MPIVGRAKPIHINRYKKSPYVRARARAHHGQGTATEGGLSTAWERLRNVASERGRSTAKCMRSEATFRGLRAVLPQVRVILCTAIFDGLRTATERGLRVSSRPRSVASDSTGVTVS